MDTEVKYGISRDAFQIMLAQQNNLCAICRTRPPKVVDHNHETLVVRGLLCQYCNRGIGLLGDNTTTLVSAIEYLTNTPSPLEKCMQDWCPGRDTLKHLLIDRVQLYIIADNYGVEYDDVLREVRNHGLPFPKDGHRCGVCSCPGKSELYRMYIEENMSMIEVAEVLGIAEPNVKKFLRIHNIPTKGVGRKRGHVCGKSNSCPGSEKLLALRSKYRGYGGNVAIAQELGISVAAYNGYIKWHTQNDNAQLLEEVVDFLI